jgi:uncharacterized membrane protein
VLAGAALSFGAIGIDNAFNATLLPSWLTVGPDAAVAILSTVAASMVSLAALVLTITMVVVQLAMGQFSPRIVQTILRRASVRGVPSGRERERLGGCIDDDERSTRE